MYFAEDNSLITNAHERGVQQWEPSLCQLSETPLRQYPISVCMDANFGYAISNDRHVRKFDLSTGETVDKWGGLDECKRHQQLTLVDGSICYCDPGNDQIVTIDLSDECAQPIQKMALQNFRMPVFIANNTKHDKKTLIVSGLSGIGKFPQCAGTSAPIWMRKIDRARGICVDDRGLIYAAKVRPSAICALSQKTGKSPNYTV